MNNFLNELKYLYKLKNIFFNSSTFTQLFPNYNKKDVNIVMLPDNKYNRVNNKNFINILSIYKQSFLKVIIKTPKYKSLYISFFQVIYLIINF